MTLSLVSVAVPVTLDRAFTYVLPPEHAGVRAGMRVLVPFGGRVLVGVVRDAVAAAPADPSKLRSVLDVLDDVAAPSLTPDLVALCEWIADYYLAPVGEVFRLPLPGALGHVDPRRIRVTPRGSEALMHASGPLFGDTPLHAHDRVLLQRIAEVVEGVPLVTLATAKPRIAGAFARALALVDQGLCELVDVEHGNDEARTEVFVRRTALLRGGGRQEEELKAILGRSKQRRSLLDILEQATPSSHPDDEGWIAVAELRGAFPRAAAMLETLVQGGLVERMERPRDLDPFASSVLTRSEALTPTADQTQVLEALLASAASGAFSVSLLHGITGSGKTEVYMQLIAAIRQRDGGAIVLVPEIALTPQLSDRFRARFGDEVAVLHSGLSPRQRVDAWHAIRDGSRPIVIGARSAVFAPVPRLGVIVVDEEHDASFKQEDGVRYHARDVALVRARSLQATVVLGSATPALETMQHARSGRYQWLSLHRRPTARPLPEVEIVPLAVHRPDATTLMTHRLRSVLEQTLDAGEQAILFLNRRGFTTSLQCGDCGSFWQCVDCSAPAMTYHLARNRLVCHLCGHIDAMPEHCAHCNGVHFVHDGVGTERVALAVAQEFPRARILRLDRDSTRGRELLRTLATFREREADILVGTQMLSKGHDFPGVTLVGILQGDHGLGLPDVRAAERTFQLLTQVAGRAGRGDRPGRVLIQAYGVRHHAVEFAARHDYMGFAEFELSQRAPLHNPPFGHLAILRVSGRDQTAVEARVRDLTQRMLPWCAAASMTDPVEVRGPCASPIARINGRTRWQTLLRCPERKPLRSVLRRLRPFLGQDQHGARSTLALVDVDPQQML